MIFYVLCNFSYCLHHSFLTGLLGIVSGSCGCPEIRTTLMPPSQAAAPELWRIVKMTNIKTVMCSLCGVLALAALTMSAGDRFTLLQTSLEIRYGHREQPGLLNTILSQNNNDGKSFVTCLFFPACLNVAAIYRRIIKVVPHYHLL